MTSGKAFVVMVGTALAGRGGMSSVVASYQQQGFFDLANVQYLEAHREVSGARKVLLVITSLSTFVRQLITGRVSLVHIHAASGVSFWRKSLFATLARLYGCPVVFHIHGGEFLEFFKHCPMAARWWVRWHLEGAARVIVLSPTWQERMQAISRHLNCEVLANPVALPALELMPCNEEKRLNFLFLGRLERSKGVFEAVEAFALVAGQYPDARLILAGDGDRAAIEHRVVELGVMEKVSFPGWVSGVTKNQLLATSHIFILPSHIEGLPVSMLEAMACGLPVIVSRVGSVPEVLEHGKNGLMVDAGSVESLRAAMEQLASSRDARAELGQAGRSLVVAKFAANKVCVCLKQIYTKVAAEVKP